VIVWLIGLSGAGKTTVGRLVHSELKARHRHVVFLDGDILRDVWGDRLGHSIDAREMNAHRISHLCRLLDRQQIHVVAAVLSIFPDWQRWNRENFSKYFQVHLDVPLDILKERDPRGLYAAADRGEQTNVVGVDIAFPDPVESDLTIAVQDAQKTPQEVADQILAALPQSLDGR